MNEPSCFLHWVKTVTYQHDQDLQRTALCPIPKHFCTSEDVDPMDCENVCNGHNVIAYVWTLLPEAGISSMDK